MNREQMILERLDSIEALLRKLMNPLPPVPIIENDFTRAKRAALDAREKSQARRQQRSAHS